MTESSTWLFHLIELRRRVIISVATIAVLFFILIYFANDFYHLIALPLLHHLPHNGLMIATTVAAPIIVPIKLVLFISAFLAVPIILYNLWAFIAPGLYAHERALIWPTLLFSILLFYLGMLFAYLVFFPLIFTFFTHAAPRDVVIMTDINAYLSFVMKLFIAFGCAFEIPIIIVVLAKQQIFSLAQLRSARPYVIVMAFVLGMFLAPPDVISQTLVAIPLCLLYEVGMLAARILK